MADYQLAHLPLSTRLELVALMLNPFRPWGQVTGLSRQYGVSRKFLYELRQKAMQALTDALLPQKPGRKAQNKAVWVDETFIQRCIAICLSVVPGTVRTVGLLLELLFGVRRSTGFISQTAQALGVRAQQDNQSLHLPLRVLAEADESFQGRQPCLTLVDGRSFLVLSLSAQAHRDETAWGCVLLDIQRQGVQLVDLASDGARGIRAGAQAAGLAIPLRPDLFHLTREAHRVTQRLEKRAYKAIGTAERARRASLEQERSKRRRGAPLKVQVAQPQAEAEERQAIEHLDAWDWLRYEIRQAIEPVSAQGQITSSRQARQTVEVALELLHTLNHETVQNFANQFREKLDELLAPLEWLEQSLAPWRAGLDPQTEAFIVWAWQHQKELGVTAEQILSESEAIRVAAFWEALSLFHRSSSLAESLHSWLRPYLQVHRGMPAWLLPLLQAVWNHHPFQRGKRQGKSPLAWAGVKEAPTLAELFDRLVGKEKPIPAPDWFFKVPQKCYPISVDI
jgi:hypothetical protein